MTMLEARKKVRFSRREAAQALDISEQTLYKWEKGTTLPNVKQFAQMCRLYGCNFTDIIIP